MQYRKFSKCKILVGRFNIYLSKFVRLYHHQSFALYGNFLNNIIGLHISKYLSVCVTGCFSKIWSQMASTKASYNKHTAFLSEMLGASPCNFMFQWQQVKIIKWQVFKLLVIDFAEKIKYYS